MSRDPTQRLQDIIEACDRLAGYLRWRIRCFSLLLSCLLGVSWWISSAWIRKRTEDATTEACLRARTGHPDDMSAHEIMAELPKLSRVELEAVEAKLQRLLGRPPARHWGEALAEFAGVAENLPTDYALNHDHYLHQAPKR